MIITISALNNYTDIEFFIADNKAALAAKDATIADNELNIAKLTAELEKYKK